MPYSTFNPEADQTCTQAEREFLDTLHRSILHRVTSDYERAEIIVTIPQAYVGPTPHTLVKRLHQIKDS